MNILLATYWMTTIVMLDCFRVVDRARAWCGMAGISYFRLSPLLASDIDMDETRDEVLLEMLWMTQAYMHEQRFKVRELIEILKKCLPPSQK